MLNVISLFSGAGGMDVGLVSAGFRVVAANEFNGSAADTFRANHPSTVMFEGDINEMIPQLAHYKGAIDLVAGGPPCQGFSVAGRMDAGDPRSQLIFSYCQAIETIKPKAFIMENVKALMVLERFSNVRDELLKRFDTAGYEVTMHLLNAADYGVPQARERVFFIGIRKDLAKPKSKVDIHSHASPGKSVREAIHRLGLPGSETNPGICSAKIVPAKNPILRKTAYSGMLFNGKGRPLKLDGYASTLPASMGGNRTPIIDNNQLYKGDKPWVESYHAHLIAGGTSYTEDDVPSFMRRLTVEEAAAIQTFPSDYLWCGSQSAIYTQIGNAVPPALAERVGRAVMDILSD